MKSMLYELCIGIIIGEVIAYFLVWTFLFGGYHTLHHLAIAFTHLGLALMKAIAITFTAYTSEFI